MTNHKLTAKERILQILRKGKPMLSMEMAEILNIPKGAASTAAKELHEAGFLHVAEWRLSKKNGGNKVYAIGPGEDAVKPEPRYAHGNRTVETRPHLPTIFVPHADVAAAWLRNPT